MEINNRHGSNRDKKNISLTFDGALLKCIPREISCNCIDNERLNNERCGLYYSSNIDYNINYNDIGYIDNVNCSDSDETNDETNEIRNKSENDSNNNNNLNDSNDISLETNENKSIDIPNYRKSKNTIKLIGNSERFLCLEICKHEEGCLIDINNKHIINRNIDTHVKKSTPGNVPVLEITDVSNDNIVNTGNMVYIYWVLQHVEVKPI
nr:MAG: hypothetical protein [Marsupenaeus japonicus endogenous nimavirus]